MALSLPDCLRWDYDDPFPKSFILCGDVFHYWHPGDREGHREEIEARDQPGLDILLLDIAELRSRYSIVESERSAEQVKVVLRPRAANEFASEATLILDASLNRLLGLQYLDLDGNRTSFEIFDYHAGLEAGTFNLPEEVRWLDY